MFRQCLSRFTPTCAGTHNNYRINCTVCFWILNKLATISSTYILSWWILSTWERECQYTFTFSHIHTIRSSSDLIYFFASLFLALYVFSIAWAKAAGLFSGWVSLTHSCSECDQYLSPNNIWYLMSATAKVTCWVYITYIEATCFIPSSCQSTPLCFFFIGLIYHSH